MQPVNGNSIPPARSNSTDGTDTFTVGEEVLNRAKEVSQRITERVRRLTDGKSYDNSVNGGGSDSAGG